MMRIDYYRHVLPQNFLLDNLVEILFVNFNGTTTKIIPAKPLSN